MRFRRDIEDKIRQDRIMNEVLIGGTIENSLWEKV